MRTFTVQMRGDRIELDACDGCKLVWFDDREVEQLGVAFDEPAEPVNRRAIAELQVHTLADSQRVWRERDAIEDFLRRLRRILF